MFGVSGRVAMTFRPPPAAAVVVTDTNEIEWDIASQGTAMVVPKPSGTVEGNLMVAQIINDDGTITPPGGWTLIRSTQNFVRQNTYYRIAGSSEPATYTWTVSLNGFNHGGAGILRITGHDPTTPIDVDTTSQASFGDVLSPAATASTEYSLRLRFSALRFATGILFGNKWSGSNPEFAAQQDAAISSTVGTHNWAASGGTDWVATTVVIKPQYG